MSNQNDTPGLLNTFRVAIGLKMSGILFAIGLGYLITGYWLVARWGMAVGNTLFLGLLLAPWERVKGVEQVRSWRLPLALALAIFFTQVEQVYIITLSPPAQLIAEIEAKGWNVEQVTMLQSEAVMFLVVPVVLASWQYGRPGLRLSIGLVFALYLLAMPFLVPQFISWPGYALSGLIRLGILSLVGLTVATLVGRQRQEQAALQVAHRQLAEQAAAMEQLATSRERNRLARELHDTLAHSLSGTAVQLQAVATLLKRDPEAARVELLVAQREVKHGMEEARRAIAALRASPLEALGLAEALHQHCRNLAERLGIVVKCEIEADLPSLPPLTEQTIYRIADEALLNCEKYAQANEVWLSLTSRPEQPLCLTIQDNGLGFDPQTVMDSGRYGLLGMAERATLIGGALQVDSRPGMGTTITLEVLLGGQDTRVPPSGAEI